MGRQLQMRFRELAFEVETGEAEMIGIDFIAKGGGNATAITDGETQPETRSAKGKGKANDAESTHDHAALSPEDEERKYRFNVCCSYADDLQSLLPLRAKPMQSRCYTNVSASSKPT